MTRAVALILLVVLGALAVHHGVEARIRDFDELWHLATGRLIAETGSVPSKDPFTFTAGSTPWVNTNWLAQVFLHALWRVGGLEADALLGLGLFLGALARVHRTAAARARSAWVAVPVLAFAWQALATGSTIRPQGWTFALLALAAAAIEALRARPTALRAAGLGVLLALSVQLHGGYIFVFGLAAAALVDGPRRHLLAALVLGAAGFLLHPHGVEALLHPIRYALDPQVKEIHAGASELQAPDLGFGTGRLLELPLLVFIAAALVGRPKLRPSELLGMALFLHLALTSRRGLHYLAIVAAAPAAATLDAALDALREGPAFARRAVAVLDALEPALRRAGRFVPHVLALAVLVVALLHAPRLRPGVPRSLDSPLLETQSDVAEVASYLRATDPPGEVWNEIATGGALIWALYPERRVYIDGRGDLHARAGTWSEMGRVFEGRAGWEGVLERWRCETVVVDQGAPLAHRLHERGWRKVFEARSRGGSLSQERWLGVYRKPR